MGCELFGAAERRVKARRTLWKDSHEAADDASSNLPFGEALRSTPTQIDFKLVSPHSSPSPPKQKLQYLHRVSSGQNVRVGGPRGGLGRGQMFDGPVLLGVGEGQQTLKKAPTNRYIRRISASIIQDSAIVCVIGHRGRSRHMNSSFLDLAYPVSSFRGRRGESRGSYYRRPLDRRGASQMMLFGLGTNSQRPPPCYSPSYNRMQDFRELEGSDSYCNLMTDKEKEWILQLLMIQVQSENPDLEDYYYQEYYRHMAKEEQGIGSRRKPPKLTTPYVSKTNAYTPVVHIEGSLGQVSVSTCYSPRRAISAVQAQGPAEEERDTRRRQLNVLGKIEKLFMILLEVEEMKRLKTAVLSEAEEKVLTEEIEKKVEYMYSEMQAHNPPISGEEFLPFLLVSKGKKLLARLLPFLGADCAVKMLRIITCNLPILMSRDAEETLSVLYQPLQNVIGGLTFGQLINVLQDLTSQSLPLYEFLALASQNTFGVSLLFALLSHGEKLLTSGVPREPGIGAFKIWTDTITQVAGLLSAHPRVEPLFLPSNLLTLFCRYLGKGTMR